MKKKEEFDPEAAGTMSSGELAGWLDERERRFAAAYNATLNGTQAAIAAGYKPGRNNASAAVQASRLLRSERVRAYRAALIRESAQAEVLTKENLTLKLLELYRRCMQAEPVMEWDSARREWVESGTWQFNAQGAAKALAQLCRLLGYDAPARIESAGSVTVVLGDEAAAYGQ